MSSETRSLFQNFWRDLQQPDMLWQAAALMVCLLLAWGIHLLVRGRQRTTVAGVWQVSQGGLQRVTFPLVALALVFTAQHLFRQWMQPHLLALAVPLLGSLAIIRTVFYVLRHTFRQAGWLATFERSFSLLVWSLLALHIMGVLPGLLGFLETIEFSIGKQRLNLWQVLQGAATVLAALLVALWVGGAIERRLLAAKELDENLKVVFARLSQAFLVMLAVLIGLPLVGIDLTTLSVFGGALGVGLGFGLQKIASSYVSGFIILLDRSIRLGNVIVVGGDRGQVTQITTRYTVLKGGDGVEVIVPNEMLIAQVVRNETLTDSSVSISLPVQVGYGSDVEQVMALMCEAVCSNPRVLADPPPKALLKEFADSGINMELNFWINDPREGVAQLRSDVNLSILRAFRGAGVEIPFPQRELRMLENSRLG